MMRLFRLTVFLLCCFCSFSMSAQNQSFTVCALNVDGLPASIMNVEVNPDGPGSDGTKRISSYLAEKGYDVIAVSEDFNYNGSLLSALEACRFYRQGFGKWTDAGRYRWTEPVVAKCASGYRGTLGFVGKDKRKL